MLLDEPIRRMYTDGQQSWPSVHLAFEAFCRHIDVVRERDPRPELPRFGAELYLCCACLARDPEATLTFEREMANVARMAISRINRDDEFVEESLRELWDKLLFAPQAKVAEYSGRGPLQAWTRVAAARTAIDRSRARRLVWTRRVELREYFGRVAQEPESMLMKARYGEAFQRSIEQALATLSVQDRNLLRMHLVDRCNIDQIGRVYGVHRATAARWLERARGQVLQSVRRHLCLEHGVLTDSEFLSIVHAMGSQIDLGLSSGACEQGWTTSQTVT